MRSVKRLMKYFSLFWLLILAPPLFCEELAESPIAETKEEVAFNLFSPSKKEAPEEENGYTINYNTVSIIEYIRFASKICNTNFIFNDEDLNFTVTVVSKDPITPENVMATLVQVLRIHNLQVIEQDGNLLIHKSDDVKQLAKVVTEGWKEGNASLVTRIFRLQNAKPESLSPIIKSMISKSAILETSSETRQLILTDITANVDKVAALIESLDSAHTTLVIRNFTTQFNTAEYLVEIVGQLMNPIAQGNPYHLVPAALSNNIYIVSTPELADRTIEILKTLDLPHKKIVAGERKLKAENIFVYKLEHRTGGEIIAGLNGIADNIEQSGIPDADLMETLETAKWIRETNSILLAGSKTSLDKVKEFIAALDIASAAESQKISFFIYKPISRTAKEVQSAIEEMAENLKGTPGSDSGMIATLQSARANPTTNTITFSGEERTFPRIKELLAAIDANGKAAKPKNSFYVYKLNAATPAQFESSLKSFAKTLDKSNAADEGLVETIEAMKYVKETSSYLFTGPETALKRLQDILPSFDGGTNITPSSQFINYKPVHNGPQLLASLKEMTEHFKTDNLADPMMIRSLESAKWIPSTGTILITGDPASLKKIQDLIGTLDIAASAKTGYFIYKLQNASGEEIEEDLEDLAKNFQSSGLKDTKIIDVIHSMRYVKETNSILLTGDQTAIDEVKDLIAKYDYPREKIAKKSNFYMYKPQHATALHIEKSLRDIGKNLSAAGLADPPLLAAINSVKYVESTNSLIFTGPPDALAKIDTLIKEVDVAPAKTTPIQHVGAKTFLLYKLKHASGSKITAALKAMTSDLKKSGTSDKGFVNALSSMKYVKETNSLMFTGDKEALEKVEVLVERFDVTGFGTEGAPHPPPSASNFFVYKPQSISGPELEKLMHDFAENLKQSGLSDNDLFSAISSMRWVEKTQSLLFTGTPKALDQVKELLRDFDIAANLPSGPMPGGPLEPTIQAIDNTSFLVYKLQFHKGDEIQGALRQIAKDLIISNAPVNQNLLNSINSIQWLEVTNSLLCSGDQETLTRLRELIKNLDIPLKQVFIEILMIQTSLSNALTFGLEWGAQYQYRNKFAGQINNITPGSAASGGGNNAASDPLLSGLSNVTPTKPPVPSDVNIIGPGFDLGVIGEVIRHGGDTYLSIGSLMAALQVDSETTIVMTPKILTQDGRTSSIFQGSNIPFAGSFISNNSATAGANATIGTTNIEYRDIGVNLTITPVLGNSDIVTLDIQLDQTQTLANAQNQQITFNQNGLPSNLNGITTSKVTMQTTVHVPDDHFLILSGIVNNSNTKLKTGIPCLGSLPLIGAAFSQDNTSINNNSVVIFLRPHIIASLDDMRRMTKHEENFFRDQTSTPYLENNFNESMELIKTVDDE
jgi:type II secretory pathway component GspD/PulD (secretin)